MVRPMTSSTRLNVRSFLSAARDYSSKALAKADANKNGYVSPAEMKGLPRDLRDNVAKYADAHGRVPVAKFKEAFVAYAKVNLHKADRNKDGVLTGADIERLPRDLKDNVKSYVAATQDVWGGGTASTVKDKTPAGRIADHQRAYGVSPVSYKEAFELGRKAVLKDREYGPGYILKEMGNGDGSTMAESKIQAELKKAFKSMELLPKGEASESGGEPAQEWIFRLQCDVGSDHGFWVNVNRQTGDAQVTSFN
jgi:hypothetical protein